MKTSLGLAATIAMMLCFFAGCGASSHRIMTVNGKMSCSFNGTSLSKICEVLTKSFGPLKEFRVEMPDDLKSKTASFELSDVTSIEPVREALEQASEHKVEIDSAKKVIRFTPK